ncbi:site-specific integrase [Streptomyces halotolerans]|uniref:Site-specific integrase n=1 Tax=Streptomyces pratisoli TaxID=3139917 RepID=A0ACC6Q9H1_9ACTN
MANATIQQRLVAVRSFYEYLVEDGLREQNPVRRGQAGRGGRRPRQGLVRHIEQAPWIPNEDVWQRILAAGAAESLRNRLMVTLAYDGALRREELVQLDVEDFEPTHRLIHLRAETTKSQRAREVAFGTTSSQLFVAYLRERRTLFGRIDGPLFRSASNRNYGAPLSPSIWSKTIERVARSAGAAGCPPIPSGICG